MTEIAAEEQAREAAKEVLRRSRQAFADVPPDELEREFDRALSEVRQDLAAERNPGTKK